MGYHYCRYCYSNNRRWWNAFMAKQKTETPPDSTKKDIARDENTEHKDKCPTGWIMYEAQQFSFCYNSLWGTPTKTDESHEEGKENLFKISFSNEEYRDIDESPTTPQLWWETEDFSPTEGDVSTTCFKCINFDQSENEIIQSLGFEEKNATASKVHVDGKDALRIHTDYFEETFDQGQINRLEYFVPNAFGNYHFQAVVSFSKADELDTFMKNLSFYD